MLSLPSPHRSSLLRSLRPLGAWPSLDLDCSVDDAHKEPAREEADGAGEGEEGVRGDEHVTDVE